MAVYRAFNKALSTLTIIADKVLDQGDQVILANTTPGAAAITVTLQPASQNRGWVFYIKKIDAGAFNVIVTADGGAPDLIDGAATYVLDDQFVSVTVVASDTEDRWYVL